MSIKTAQELAAAAEAVAKNHKTLYVMGCFGAPMTEKNKTRYANNHSYNKDPERTAKIMAASEDTFGFDCVNLIKGLLWGWEGDPTKTYGGAKYKSNGVPDTNANGLINRCTDVSTDFSNIMVGEVVHMSGHVGIYIGNGLAVECTPKWEDRVQITAVGNIGKKSSYKTRTWKQHGKLPYVEYPTAANTELYRVIVEGLPKTQAENLAKMYEGTSIRVTVEAIEPEMYVPAENDKVYFNGGVHYSHADAAEGTEAAAGEAIITRVYKPGQSKHPYHLKRTGKTGPYGWVDAGTFKKI